MGKRIDIERTDLSFAVKIEEQKGIVNKSSFESR